MNFVPVDSPTCQAKSAEVQLGKGNCTLEEERFLSRVKWVATWLTSSGSHDFADKQSGNGQTARIILKLSVRGAGQNGSPVAS
jgi:hypothetical protein